MNKIKQNLLFKSYRLEICASVHTTVYTICLPTLLRGLTGNGYQFYLLQGYLILLPISPAYIVHNGMIINI